MRQRGFITGIVLLLASSAAAAQPFPNRPLTLICAYGAGASGTIGPTYIARNAKPDGYVIGQMPLTVFRLPHMEKVNFDPVQDFTWIIGVTGYSA